MLTIAPLKKENLSLDDLKKYGCESNDIVVILAKDGQRELGFISFNIFKYKAEILNIEFQFQQYDNELADSLIRSLAVYAMNRNVFVVESKNKDIFFILDGLEFKRINDKMEMDLTKLVKKCKSV